MTESASPSGYRRSFIIIIMSLFMFNSYSRCLLMICYFLKSLRVLHAILPIGVENLRTVVRCIALFDEFALI